MKKLYIVWAALVAVVLLVLVLHRLPEHNPDFGWVADEDRMLKDARTGFFSEPSGKQFDIIYYVRLVGGIKLRIRPNYGDELYVDRANSKLEMRLLGVLWVDAPVPEGEDGALGEIVLSPSRVYDYYTLEADLNFHSPDAMYRLTLVFTEYADGSGERYTLRLRISP